MTNNLTEANETSINNGKNAKSFFCKLNKLVQLSVHWQLFIGTCYVKCITTGMLKVWELIPASLRKIARVYLFQY